MQHNRLRLNELEERLVPAWNLSIDGNATTSGVSSTFTHGQTTFTATSTATINVADIEAALAVGNVKITTGTTGGSAGQITWNHNANSDALNYFGSLLRTLTFDTDASGTDPNINFTGIVLNAKDNLHLQVLSDNNINLNGATVNDAYQITMTAANFLGTLTNASTLESMTGNIVLDAPLLQVGKDLALISRSGDVTNTSTTTSVPNGVTLKLYAPLNDCDVTGNVFSSGGVGGNVRVGALRAQFGNIGTDPNPLNTLTIESGDLTFTTANALNISIGDDIWSGNGSTSFGNAAATLTQNVNGNVNVYADGILAPGGVLSSTLSIAGNLLVDGGEYRLSVGNAVDRVVVNGTATIQGGAKLRGDATTNALPNTNPVTIFQHTGIQTGSFSGGDIDRPFWAGRDAVAVVSNSLAANGTMMLAKAPGVAGNSYSDYLHDGTKYNVRLRGPGELIVAPNVNYTGIAVIVHGSTSASSLIITKQANGGTAPLILDKVSINGPLGIFSAPTATLNGSFYAARAIKSLTLGHTYDNPTLTNEEILIGGSATDRVNIRIIGSSYADLLTTCRLQTLKVGTYLAGDVVANSIGTVSATQVFGNILTTTQGFDVLQSASAISSKITVGTTLGSVRTSSSITGSIVANNLGTVRANQLLCPMTVTGHIKRLEGTMNLALDLVAGSVGTIRCDSAITPATSAGWQVTGGIETIQAAAMVGIQCQASYLTNLIVKPTRTPLVNPGIDACDFVFTGNNGAARGSYGLKVVSVVGAVKNSTFNVLNGHVGRVTVGQFTSSKLYVGYNGDPQSSTGFNNNTFATGPFRLGVFKTTAQTQTSPEHTSNYAFSRSEIVAETLGTVRLSGVLTSGTTFAHGIKYRNGTPSIQFASCSANVDLNKNLAAVLLPIADNFWIADV